MRKNLVLMVLLGLFSFCICNGSEVLAQRYPDRPIQIVVPWGAGGPADLVSRLVGDQMGKELKTPVAIINKGGAGGALGASFVAQAKKDGYTLMATTQAAYVTAIIQPKEVSYDMEKDFDPLGRVVETAAFVQVKGTAPWKNLGEFMTYVQNNPKKLSCGTAPVGTIPHFVWLRLNSLGFETNGVICASDPEGISYLSGGHIDVLIQSIHTAAPHVRDKAFRALAVTTEKRTKPFPDIPTFAEAGYPDVGSFPGFIAFFAPMGTPRPVVEVLVSGLQKAMKDPGVVDKLEKMDFTAEYLPPREYKQWVPPFVKRVRIMAERAGIIK